MKIQISHGADPGNWFVVQPLPDDDADELAVASLLRARRTVYEVDAQPWLGDYGPLPLVVVSHSRQEIADILAAAVTTDGAHHKQHDLEQIAAILGIDLPDHEPGIEA